jgi:hypothetical protein
MSNLVAVLNDLGRVSESTILAGNCDKWSPTPPSLLRPGLAAVRKGDRRQGPLRQELTEHPTTTVPFLACRRLYRSWRNRAGKKELTLAMQSSPTQNDRAVMRRSSTGSTRTSH